MLETEPKKLDARSWRCSLKFEYRLHSPASDADDLGRPCNSLFEVQVVQRYVIIVVLFCLK